MANVDPIEGERFAEAEQVEPCAICFELTTEYDEDLRMRLHDRCRAEYIFGE